MLKIREIRKAKGLTMKQLGDMVGALESSISFYERGLQQPDLDMLRKIADALSVSTDELLWFEGKWFHTRSVIGSSPI